MISRKLGHEDSVCDMANVKEENTRRIDTEKESLPSSTQVIVLDPVL